MILRKSVLTGHVWIWPRFQTQGCIVSRGSRRAGRTLYGVETTWTATLGNLSASSDLSCSKWLCGSTLFGSSYSIGSRWYTGRQRACRHLCTKRKAPERWWHMLAEESFTNIERGSKTWTKCSLQWSHWREPYHWRSSSRRNFDCAGLTALQCANSTADCDRDHGIHSFGDASSFLWWCLHCFGTSLRFSISRFGFKLEWKTW